MAYAVVADLRALDGLADTTTYPDATLQQGIDFATAVIDRYSGTSFEYKSFNITTDGNGRYDLYIGVLFPRTLSSVTIDGVAANTANIRLRPEGVLVRTDGIWSYDYFWSNIVIGGTAGYTSTAPDEIKWACRTIARQWCLELHSRIPSRALQVQSEYGQLEVRAQAGGPGRPTSLPDVNVVLNRFKFKPGHTGTVVS